VLHALEVVLDLFGHVPFSSAILSRTDHEVTGGAGGAQQRTATEGQTVGSRAKRGVSPSRLPRGPSWRGCETVDTFTFLTTLSHMARTDRDRLVALARRRRTVTAADTARAGIHSQQLTRLVAEGVLERLARGLYRLADQQISEHQSLLVVARAVPNGVICLLSALDFHGIGTQLPAEVWVAIERGARAPVLAYPPLRVVRFSGAAFTEGVEDHRADGQNLRVYSVAKTIADLFKYRNRVGVDVAIEALRDAWRERRFTMEALDRAARACRVTRVLRPYVEGIVA
jgi:predicted transcriptional regulator of viral defense system